MRHSTKQTTAQSLFQTNPIKPDLDTQIATRKCVSDVSLIASALELEGDSGMRDARDSGKTGEGRVGRRLHIHQSPRDPIASSNTRPLSLPNIFFLPINRISGRPALGKETRPEEKIL